MPFEEKKSVDRVSPYDPHSLNEALEGDSCSETNIAFADTDRISDKTKVVIVYITLRIAEVSVVKKIESLATQLELDTFGYRDRFKQTEVDIEVARTDKIVSAGASKPCSILR
jgi:hypothetical protein